MFLLSLGLTSSAQQVEGLVNKGDNLKNRYRFEEALESYRMALETAEQQSDSIMARIIDDRILMAENSAADRRFHKAVYAPGGLRKLYWSAEDEEGTRNLYTSSLQDSVWVVPALINEQLTSVSDEIYPLLSADGRHLYFSSAGLQGVGGYELFVS